ncbi:NupC/NupG family nucleoside CNT transporter [Thiorhodovibrio litoralis]|uniref:NupC/NupG family nucleoside CNT transporter n=1 Tax=Thiorhodovibrio litoralis TaxID=2952932 RepID=UPI002B262915|nr:nucleoside transporter C-terminal domain-containing protein [Thiorhodovibrio litoralis]
MSETLAPTLQALFGLLVLLGIAWLLSESRREVSLRLVLGGLGLQLLLGVLLLKWPAAKEAFLLLNEMVLALQKATDAGAQFVFGYLAGSEAPFAVTAPEHGFVFAFRALPLILVVSALSALLFHWRVLPLVVRGFAWVLRRTLGTSGALGLATAANVFIGMTEAPLLIRPYLKTMSRSALFALMVSGMATIAGTVMLLYASILSGIIPNAMGQILTASLMSAPAALVIAGIMLPEASQREPFDAHIEIESESAMDAITRGALAAIPLMLNVMALLIVMLALVSLANDLLGLLPQVADAPLSLERLLGWVFAPIVWLIGIPWQEAQTAGALMGTKTVLNELIAYVQLTQLSPDALSERSRLIMLYALCGFANFGSLGIMIGGLASIAPERRSEIVALGMKSILAGTLATLMTGAIAGLLL